MALKIIHTKHLRWIDIMSPSKVELDYLKTEFDFHPIDIESIETASEHSKIEHRENYSFIVFLFPVYDQKSMEIMPAEVDFFVGPGYVVTIHNGSMFTMTSSVDGVANDDTMRSEWMGKNYGILFHKILEQLFRRSFPILDYMSKDMGEIEKRVFKDSDLNMVRRIAQMKRNIIDVRRIMKTHHLILRRLTNSKESYLTFSDSKDQYGALMDHIENIWDILAIQKETIESLQDANQAIATNTLNQLNKASTILSGVFFPATLIIFLFSIDEHGKPFENLPYGFWIVAVIAIVSSSFMIWYFRKKRWM
jgi:magnesium transporter